VVYDRYALAIGEEVQGPALIPEYGSTTYLDIRDSLKVGPAGELCIKCDLTQ